MTLEELNKWQSGMPDEELIKTAEKQLSELCITGGKSFRMSVPVDIKDTDMVFSEIIRRFSKTINYEISK